MAIKPHNAGSEVSQFLISFGGSWIVALGLPGPVARLAQPRAILTQHRPSVTPQLRSTTKTRKKLPGMRRRPQTNKNDFRTESIVYSPVLARVVGVVAARHTIRQR